MIQIHWYWLIVMFAAGMVMGFVLAAFATDW